MVGQPLLGAGLVISVETSLLPKNGTPDGVIGPPVSLVDDANESVGRRLRILRAPNRTGTDRAGGRWW
jgi:hypothetical protein